MPFPDANGTGTPTQHAGEPAALQDDAVTFLHQVAPPSAGDRTRAFAALLRVLTTPASVR